MYLNSHVEKTTLPFLAINKFVEDAQITEAIELVNQLDFIDQNATLISYHGWEKTKVLETEVIYKKWLALHKAYNQEIVIAPNKQLDEYWHFHTLKIMDDF
jgi:hypothetical protein